MTKTQALVVLGVALSLGAASARAQPMLRLPDDREGWPVGLCVHKAAQAEGSATEALDALGAAWVRIDVNWNEVEPAQGVFVWDEMDRMVDTARAHGLLVFATLAYTPAWATGGSVRNGVPSSADLYASFVTAVVSRYRDRVKHWGMWNEPEQGRFWDGSAQQYVDLVLVPGADAVHAADPDALVLGPDSGSDDYLDDVFSAGGGDVLDVITVHVYACCDDSDDVAKVLWRLDCTGGFPWDSCRRNVIEDHGLGDKPVWLTEVGWKTLTPEWENRQAELYGALLDAMRERPWWKKTIFYELWDETACDPGLDNCWGITRTDWSHKPAFDALAADIPAHQPRAEAGPDLAVAPGQPALLDGTASADPDGVIARHRWDFDRTDGVHEQAEGETVRHAWGAAGTYVVTLVVTDTHGAEDADTTTVVVSGDPWPDAGAWPDAGGPGQDAGVEHDAGSAGEDGGPADDTPDDGADGCGCRTAGLAPPTGAAAGVLLAIAIFASAARRSRSSSRRGGSSGSRRSLRARSR